MVSTGLPVGRICSCRDKVRISRGPRASLPAGCRRREHCRKCVVTPPEMVEKGGRKMQRDETEQLEADGLVHHQELPSERTILTDQGRQLAEEE